MTFFVSVARGLAPIVAQELEACGARETTVHPTGIRAEGDLAFAYRVCLWSRAASRLILVLARHPITDADDLYQQAQTIAWDDHLSPDGTMVVDVAGTHLAIRNSAFAALKVKDAIVDQLRARHGRRPAVDKRAPQTRVHLFLDQRQAQIGIDLSGGGLHRRGYRLPRMAAPLRESLAAGLLCLADWPRRAAAGEPFVDPMCGSGTLPIEAALIAADVAPGLLRGAHGFAHWRGHDAALWKRLVAAARARDRRRFRTRVAIVGSDVDSRTITSAKASLQRAGLAQWVSLDRRDVASCRPPRGIPGLVVVNPPYGERLGEPTTLAPLYRSLGETLKQHFAGYTACVLSGSGELSRALRLKAAMRHQVFNGAIDCRLLCYPLTERSPTVE